MEPIGVPAGEWSVGYGRSPRVDGMTMVATWGGGAFSANAAARMGRLMMRNGNWNGRQLVAAEMAQTVLPTTAKPERVHELPFDTDRMRMSTVHATPEGPMLYCKGAPESIAPLCSRVLADGVARPFTPEVRSKILAAQNAMAEQGLRVLALAYRALDSRWTPEGLERDLVWAGLVGVQDPPRREVEGALLKCREDQIVIDLVRLPHASDEMKAEYRGICW
jgi:magnesium-transporting ATPase (P-type)